jgi:hypothetical protein
MQKQVFSLLIFIQLINPIFPTHSQYQEESKRYLNVYSDENERTKPLVIKNTNQDLLEAIHSRYRRDLSGTADRNDGIKNITTKVSLLLKKMVFILIILLFFVCICRLFSSL